MPKRLGFSDDENTYQFGPKGAALSEAVSVHDDYFGLIVEALDEALSTALDALAAEVAGLVEELAPEGPPEHNGTRLVWNAALAAVLAAIEKAKT